MLVNQAGLVFCGERLDTPQGWQMPQGGVNEGEALAEAALRELAEEVGTDKAEIIAQSPTTYRYDFPAYLKGKVGYADQYRGQEQTWFLMRFLGEDGDINIHTSSPGCPPEFSRWQWVAPETLPRRIVPFKRLIYQAVVEAFMPLIRGI